MFFYSAILLFEPVAFVFIAIFLLLSVLSVGLEIFRKKNEKKPKLARSIKFSRDDGIRIRPINTEKVNPFDSLLNTALFVFILICAFYALLIYCEYKAKDDVSKTIEKIKSCNIDESSLIYTKQNRNPIFVITCGTNNCAGIDIEQPGSCRNWLDKHNKLKIIYFENKTEFNNFYNYAK